MTAAEPGSPAPAASFLLAVYNDERYLPAAIGSIVGQTFTDFEVVVIDDASTDATPRILRDVGDARFRVVRNPTNVGLISSLNRGLTHCRGEVVARFDGDDVCEPGRLAAQMQYLRDHPDLIGCASWTTEIDEDDRVIGAERPFPDPAYVRWALCHRNVLYHSTMAIRRRVLQDAGGYDEGYPASEDYECWTRLVGQGHRIGVVPAPLIRYRRRRGSITAQKAELQHQRGIELATRLVGQILGSCRDAADVGLMRSFMSWQPVDPAQLSRPRVRRALALMADLRRAALPAGGSGVVAAADDEAADRLLQHGRRLLKDAPGASAQLAWYVAGLPRHRCHGLDMLATATRCVAGRWLRPRTGAVDRRRRRTARPAPSMRDADAE